MKESRWNTVVIVNTLISSFALGVIFANNPIVNRFSALLGIYLLVSIVLCALSLVMFKRLSKLARIILILTVLFVGTTFATFLLAALALRGG